MYVDLLFFENPNTIGDRPESKITYHNMRYPIIFGIAATIALVQTHPARAKSSTEVAQVAKAITVMITTQGSIGSGVIIKHEGDTYTILTAAHVVKSTSETYTLTTADGKQHQLNNATIKKLPKSIDLAIVKFTSTNTYPIAKIGSSSQALEGTTVYAAGFPAPTRAITQSVYAFKDGKVIANSSRELEGGYGIVYSCNTLPGMSGGIFNDNGELIAIHGITKIQNHRSFLPCFSNPISSNYF
jgi:serine protease Do